MARPEYLERLFKAMYDARWHPDDEAIAIEYSESLSVAVKLSACAETTLLSEVRKRFGGWCKEHNLPYPPQKS